MPQSMYEIRVAGDVPEEDLRDMGAVSLAPEQVNTVLYGISDEAALYGLLDRLRALGIEVVEIRRVADPDDAGRAADDEQSGQAGA